MKKNRRNEKIKIDRRTKSSANTRSIVNFNLARLRLITKNSRLPYVRYIKINFNFYLQLKLCGRCTLQNSSLFVQGMILRDENV